MITEHGDGFVNTSPQQNEATLLLMGGGIPIKYHQFLFPSGHRPLLFFETNGLKL